jgi:hypothetical protein
MAISHSLGATAPAGHQVQELTALHVDDRGLKLVRQ